MGAPAAWLVICRYDEDIRWAFELASPQLLVLLCEHVLLNADDLPVVELSGCVVLTVCSSLVGSSLKVVIVTLCLDCVVTCNHCVVCIDLIRFSLELPDLIDSLLQFFLR